MADIKKLEGIVEELRERIATSDGDKIATLAAFDGVTMLLIEVIKGLDDVRFALNMKD